MAVVVYFSWIGVVVSEELKEILIQLIQERSKREEREIEERIDRFKSLLLRIANEKKLDFAILVEGTPSKDLEKDRQDLEMLAKANMLKGETMYTHRNQFRQYTLTLKGAELAEKLSKEK